jgi:argonaute-like protein implicated in RNA metabolism and viral defense
MRNINLAMSFENLTSMVELDDFPKIQQYVDENWGTVRLKNYLEGLMYDTRGGQRKGFPENVSSAILSLSLANLFVLECEGLTFEEPDDTGFSNTKWKLPKNF